RPAEANGWFALSNEILQPIHARSWLRAAPTWNTGGQLADVLGRLLPPAAPTPATTEPATTEAGAGAAPTPHPDTGEPAERSAPPAAHRRVLRTRRRCARSPLVCDADGGLHGGDGSDLRGDRYRLPPVDPTVGHRDRAGCGGRRRRAGTHLRRYAWRFGVPA